MSTYEMASAYAERVEIDLIECTDSKATFRDGSITFTLSKVELENG